MDRYKSKLRIKRYKYHLNAYRHELSRVKGMNKVVVPRVMFSVDEIKGQRRTGKKNYYAMCKCGNDNLYSGNGERYCPWCGKLLLWEKVKQ